MKKFFIFALSNGVNAAYGDNDNLGLFDIILPVQLRQPDYDIRFS